jgi:hypothetical protein
MNEPDWEAILLYVVMFFFSIFTFIAMVLC